MQHIGGGVDIASTMTEEASLKAADAFLTYNKVGIDEERDGDEALVEELGWWTTGKKLVRNPMSLEHASTHRFMSESATGVGGKVSTSLNEETRNLDKGRSDDTVLRCAAFIRNHFSSLSLE